MPDAVDGPRMGSGGATLNCNTIQDIRTFGIYILQQLPAFIRLQCDVKEF